MRIISIIFAYSFSTKLISGLAVAKTAILTAIFSLLLATTALATELIMVEEPGCIYCEKWKQEVGGKYHKTELGAAAPLRMLSKAETRNAIELARPVVYTPTFIFVEDSIEFARPEGYQSEDFFWALSEQILAEHQQTD